MVAWEKGGAEKKGGRIDRDEERRGDDGMIEDKC